MNWSELYNETKEIWQQEGSDDKGFAIFYSPVKIRPKLAIVGLNPGGNERSSSQDGIPDKHDYFAHENDYKLARNMKIIFEEAGLLEDLKQSVKFNLYFFRTKTANELTNKRLKSYSAKKSFEILAYIKPVNIITESFAVFQEVIKEFNGLEVGTIYGEDGLSLISAGHLQDGTNILGLRHPSATRNRLSDRHLKEMGRKLKNLID